jgi:hypothetical protein
MWRHLGHPIFMRACAAIDPWRGPLPSAAYAYILHNLGPSTTMSAFDVIAQSDLGDLENFVQPPSSGAVDSTVIPTNGRDPFESHLFHVSARYDELRHAFWGNEQAVDQCSIELGDALRGLASVALDRLLSLRDDAALSVSHVLQWVSELRLIPIHTLK